MSRAFSMTAAALASRVSPSADISKASFYLRHAAASERNRTVAGGQEAADDVGAVTGLGLLLIEAFRHPLVPAFAFAGGEAFGQSRAFFERFERAPERLFEDVALRGEHRLRRVGVADATAKADEFVVLDLPQHAAAIGTGEGGRLAGTLVGAHCL